MNKFNQKALINKWKIWAIYTLLIVGSITTFARPLSPANVESLKQAGQALRKSTNPINLEKGVYAVRPLNMSNDKSYFVQDTNFLFLEEVNERAGDFVGIMIDIQALGSDKLSAPKATTPAANMYKDKVIVFKAKPILGGSSAALIPFNISSSGYAFTHDAYDSSAPYIQIASQDAPYPLRLEGHNGFLNGHLLEMKKVSNSKVEWLSSLSNGVYYGPSENTNLTINGDYVTLLLEGKVNQTYSMTPINSDFDAKLFGLSQAQYDVMTDEIGVSDSYKLFTIFVKDIYGDEKTLLLMPSDDGFPGRHSRIVFNPRFKAPTEEAKGLITLILNLFK